MSDDARSSARCVLCGQSLDPIEPRLGVPDLLIEMHESCYRPHTEGAFGGRGFIRPELSPGPHPKVLESHGIGAPIAYSGLDGLRDGTRQSPTIVDHPFLG